VSTTLLSTICCPGVEACIALSAYHLVTVVFLGQDPERGFDDSSSETENQVEGGLLLDVVVRQGSPVLKLLSSKDQPLLIRWNTLLVLDLGLDILDGVGGFDL